MTSKADKLLIGKIVTTIGVFFLCLLGVWAPFRFGRLRQTIKIMGISAAFASGVILGAGFSHLLPDAEESFATYFEKVGTGGLASYKDTEYPFAQLVAMATLICLTSVDHVFVRKGIDGHGHSHGGHSHAIPSLPDNYQDHHHKHEHHHVLKEESRTPPQEQQEHGHGYQQEDHHQGEQQNNQGQQNSQPQQNGQKDQSPVASPDSVDYKVATPPAGAEAGVVAIDVVEKGDKAVVPTGESVESDNSASADEAQKILRGTKAQIAEAWIFFSALSLHSVFDGMSIGGETDLDGFYALLITVCSHKLLDGFSLGIPLYLANLPRNHTIFAALFCSFMTPLGLIIGTSITSALEGSAGVLAEALILSLSAGSFIFISLIELLPAALRDGQNLRLKLLMLTFGWGFMALIALWA